MDDKPGWTELERLPPAELESLLASLSRSEAEELASLLEQDRRSGPGRSAVNAFPCSTAFSVASLA